MCWLREMEGTGLLRNISSQVKRGRGKLGPGRRKAQCWPGGNQDHRARPLKLVPSNLDKTGQSRIFCF